MEEAHDVGVVKALISSIARIQIAGIPCSVLALVRPIDDVTIESNANLIQASSCSYG